MKQIEKRVGLALVGGFVLMWLFSPTYVTTRSQARESSLKQNLFTLRQMLWEYSQDKQEYPRSLEELVKAGYLREIPVDPVTGRADWILERASPGSELDGKTPRIVDVHSASRERSRDGAEFREW